MILECIVLYIHIVLQYRGISMLFMSVATPQIQQQDSWYVANGAFVGSSVLRPYQFVYAQSNWFVYAQSAQTSLCAASAVSATTTNNETASNIFTLIGTNDKLFHYFIRFKWAPKFVLKNHIKNTHLTKKVDQLNTIGVKHQFQ